MGLKLNKTIKGIVCEYWIITRLREDKRINKTFVNLSLYYNSDSRTADIYNMLYDEMFTFDGIDFTRIELYEKIKLEEGFTGAVDV